MRSDCAPSICELQYGTTTVAGIRRVAFATVAHDGVIRNSGRDRDGVDRLHKATVRRVRLHAVRDAFEIQFAGPVSDNLAKLVPRFKESNRCSNQTGSDAPDPTAGLVAATQRR